MVDGLAQSWNPTTSNVNLASTHMVQNVFEIVDELATQLESMHGTFESNAVNEQEEANEIDLEHEDNDEHLWDYDMHANFYIEGLDPQNYTTMLLMNVFIVDGVNNKCVDELLFLLHKYLLPLGNCLPTNMYHAKALTHKVGLNYKLILACQNGCVVSRCVCRASNLSKMWISLVQKFKSIK
jgi:hypothetical protein